MRNDNQKDRTYRQAGLAPLILLILLPFIIGFIYISIQRGTIKIGEPVSSGSPIAEVIETPTIEPTALPTTVSTNTPTPIVTKAPTTKPTVAPVSGPPGSGLSTINVATEKGNFSATILSMDLANTRVITDTANDSECTSNCSVKSVQDFVSQNGGFAGINGTYFCPAEPAYASCGQNNSFDFPVWNTRLSKWINGGNLGWNSRSLMYFDGSGGRYMQNAGGVGGLNAGFVMNPGLLDGGNVQIDDSQSGLSDKQKSVGLKAGIGINGSKVMVVVAQSVNMQQFAYVFKSLGATSAINLDVGGSTAFYHQGRYVYGPGRGVPNAIIFASK